MEIVNIRCKGSELKSEAFKYLAGKIFHVTTNNALSSILKTGYIYPTGHRLSKPQWAGSKKSFFGNMDCVSVCDLFNNNRNLIEKAIKKYYFLDPLHSKMPVYLILDSSVSNNLISYDEWKRQNATSQIVPGLEAGYKGNIPISKITTAVCVKYS